MRAANVAFPNSNQGHHLRYMYGRKTSNSPERNITRVLLNRSYLICALEEIGAEKSVRRYQKAKLERHRTPLDFSVYSVRKTHRLDEQGKEELNQGQTRLHLPKSVSSLEAKITALSLDPLK
jgi:hypothetical protein